MNVFLNTPYCISIRHLETNKHRQKPLNIESSGTTENVRLVSGLPWSSSPFFFSQLSLLSLPLSITVDSAVRRRPLGTGNVKGEADPLSPAGSTTNLEFGCEVNQLYLVHVSLETFTRHVFRRRLCFLCHSQNRIHDGERH